MKFLCFLVECRLGGGCRLGGKGQYSTEKRCAPLAAIIIYDQLSESGSHGDVSCHYVSSNMARRCDRVKCTAYESRNCGFG